MSSAGSSKRTPFRTSIDCVFSPPSNWKAAEELCDIERGEANAVANLTLNIVSIYKKCNSEFKSIEVLPQRLLSNPGESASNNGYDNVEGNLICRVHDKLKSGEKTFTILDLLGTGTFGQVFRCKRDDTKELVAVKVIKNKPAYHTQGMLEIKIAKLLNSNYDPSNDKHIVRLLESFEYHGHICLVFELLSMSLLDLLTQNQFRGLPLSIVQRFTKQILTSLVVLEDANVIHCDLKPENILIVPQQSRPRVSAREKEKLKSESNELGTESSAANNKPDTAQQSPQKKSSSLSDVKVIDFGSACFEGRTIYSYIQSRFYRSPEVLLGAPYTGAIDMWSLACVCAEMYLGLPLFPGISQHNQLSRIVEVLGVPPDFLIESKHGLKYFTSVEKESTGDNSVSSEQEVPKSSSSFLTSSSITSNNSTKYRIKTPEEYAAETNTEIPVLKKYLRYTLLEDIIMKCSLPNKAKLTTEQKNAEMIKRQSFLDFLRGLFKLNPFERWTAKQAMEHPFIRNVPLAAPFVPPQDLKVQERKLLYMVQLQQRYGNLEGESNSNGKLPVATKGLKAMPSNFGSSGAQPSFTPLQYSNRRLSEPIDPHTAALKMKLQTSGTGSNVATAANGTAASTSSASASSGGFENSDRPMLKRGAPVHAKASNNESSSAISSEVNTVSSSGEEANNKTVNSVSEAMQDTSISESQKSQSQSSTMQPSSGSGKMSHQQQLKPRRSFSDKQQSNAMSINNASNPAETAYAYGAAGPALSSSNPNQNGWMGPTNNTNMMPPQAFIHGTPPNFPSMMPPPPFMSAYPPPPPHMLGPGMPQQGMPYYGAAAGVDANGTPIMYTPAIPVPTLEPYYGGSLVGSLGGSQLVGSYVNGQLAGSLGNPNMASSFAPSSYGVFAVGSDSANNTTGSLRMKEFATNLHRGEADEQRRFLSQQQMMFASNGMPMAANGPPFWPPPPAQASYTPYNMHNMMMDPNNAANNNSGNMQMPNNPHFQGSIANYILNNPASGANMQQMAQSYDSRIHQRMMLARQPMPPPSMTAMGMNMGMMAPANYQHPVAPNNSNNNNFQSNVPFTSQQQQQSGGSSVGAGGDNQNNAVHGQYPPQQQLHHAAAPTLMPPQHTAASSATTASNAQVNTAASGRYTADNNDAKSIDSSDNNSGHGNSVATRSISRQRAGSHGTGGNNTPSSSKPGASDADWDPFFEADD